MSLELPIGLIEKKTTHPTPRLQLNSVHCPVETTFFQWSIQKVTEHVQITYSTLLFLVYLFLVLFRIYMLQRWAFALFSAVSE